MKNAKTSKIANSPLSAVKGMLAKKPTTSIPIVGIGASAGGLEAIDVFLNNVPDDSGMAFVIVQHLDPTHKGMMPELLQRTTSMQVLQATDKIQVKSNCVYVIPPNSDLSVLHGKLHLFEPVEPRGLRLPIDFFFRSLALDQSENSIGVILSGMGSDGTLGLRAIKEKAGLVLVQSPETAKFDAMPKSVIDAGLADIIAPADELPIKIFEFTHHTAHVIEDKKKSLDVNKMGALDKTFIILREHTGHDFSLYKKSTLYRRIERRMSLHQLNKIVNYERYLRENPQEIDLLFKELLIGVTNFFRDAGSWQHLKMQVMPVLLSKYPTGKVIRAWVVGCSTGEEAYSLAIIFKEALAELKLKKRITIQIFATDLDPDAIEKARLGSYPLNIVSDVSEERLSNFFDKEDTGYRICKEIREMVVFAPHNVIMDPPFTKLDIITCRNLLIYFGAELQQKLLPLFHYCLNSSGILMLGSAESIGTYDELYSVLDNKTKFFQRGKNLLNINDVNFPSRANQVPKNEIAIVNDKTTTVNLQIMAEKILLEKHAPAAVLVNSKGDILNISGHTGKYLEPAAGKANWNIFAMSREGLRNELSLLLPKAVRENTTLVQHGIQVGSNGRKIKFDITIQVIDNPDALHGLILIVFKDVAALPKVPSSKKGSAKGRMAELELALQKAHEEAQSAREEMQSQQEEVKSTNEELQSTNEELQSTNEELTTSKEEMQSLNEELQTVNIELQSKVDDLSTTNSDMKNLLDSTGIATIFLDNGMHVRRYTSHATDLFKLITSDIGRPLSDLVTNLDYPTFEADAHEVLRSLVFTDKQVQSKDGSWYQVKIMPYRTLDNLIDGVVMTFNNITDVKIIEASLKRSDDLYRGLFDNSLYAVAHCKMIYKNKKPIDFLFLEVNKVFSDVTGMKDVKGKKESEVIPGIQKSDPDLFEVCGRVADTGESEQLEFYVKASKQWYKTFIYSSQKGFFVSVNENITKRKQTQKSIEESRSILRNYFNNKTVKLGNREALEITLSKIQDFLN